MNTGREKHIDEQLLETYAVDPDAVSQQDRRIITTHLQSCMSCRNLLDFFEDIYTTFRSLPEPDAGRVDRMLNDIFPLPLVIELTPLGPSAFERAGPGDVYNNVVLADTEPPTGNRFETIASLANRDEKVLLRIMMDRTRSELTCYLLSEDPRKQEHALISFPEGVHIITDSSGKASVRPPQASDPISRAEVRYPSSKIDVSVEDTGEAHIDAEEAGCLITYTPDRRTLSIACDADSGIAGIGVVEKDTGSAHYAPLLRNQASVQLSDELGELAALLYRG